MECKKVYSLIIVVISFSPLTFGVWPIKTYIDVPVIDGFERTCKDWIEFYGINDQNYVEMVVPTRERDYAIDKELIRFVVGYAYRLTISKDSILDNNFNIYLSPTKFCDELGFGEDLKTFNFEALKEVRGTCPDFIHMYGYSRDNILYNRSIANSIKLGYELYESNWSALYRLYMKKRGITHVTPSKFCAYLGKTEPALQMPFVSHQDFSMMPCEDIIRLYDYTDDPRKNYKKAFTRNLYAKIKLLIPDQVLDYVEDLKNNGKYQAKTIKDFCDSRGNSSSYGSAHRSSHGSNN